MSAKTLYDKLWDDHVVATNDDGSVLLYPNRSDADLMSFRVGVSFALR